MPSSATPSSQKIQAVVFDLDDTLLDTAGLLIPIAHTPQFLERIRKPLPLMEGALENLKSLSTRYDLYLLTQGQTQIQNQKIDSLNIRSFFIECYIVDPILADKSQGSCLSKPSDTTLIISKENYFSLAKRKYDTAFLSIGNRMSTDLRGARKNGGKACLFSYGEHQDEVAETEWDAPDYKISHHRDLIRECHL